MREAKPRVSENGATARSVDERFGSVLGLGWAGLG
jgi:hypothetical protein